MITDVARRVGKEPLPNPARHILPRHGRRKPAIHVVLPAQDEDVDADLRRHDDKEATVASVTHLFPGESYLALMCLWKNAAAGS